jgi:hypothetical protein
LGPRLDEIRRWSAPPNWPTLSPEAAALSKMHLSSPSFFGCITGELWENTEPSQVPKDSVEVKGQSRVGAAVLGELVASVGEFVAGVGELVAGVGEACRREGECMVLI